MVQLLTSMSSIHLRNTQNGSVVVVLGATDPALHQAGQFDREIMLGAPDKGAWEGILQAMMPGMRVVDNLNYRLLAKKTNLMGPTFGAC